jgi:2-amino-4-hydroxy-6-hydroxymethyldihydropteridine diphosphokinase
VLGAETIKVPTRVYLSLGSNLGDRATNLRQAIAELARQGSIAATSSLYETEPVELTDQPWFLNCAVALDTETNPDDLLQHLLIIEKRMGRERTQPKGPRILDIDILLFGNVIVKLPGLTIPHPALHQRRFVLEPLAEIAPDVRHPILQLTIQELLAQFPAGQEVRRLS